MDNREATQSTSIAQSIQELPKQNDSRIITSVYKKGSFRERFFAYLIDGIILFAVQVIMGIAATTSKIPALTILPPLIVFLYAILFLGISGATPGMKLLKLKALDTSYKKIGIGTAIVRSLASMLSSLALHIGYFWVIIDQKKQTWHDKMASTYVVKLDSSGNLIPIFSEEAVTTGRRVAFWLLSLFFGMPIVAATIALLIYIFLFRPFQVSGDSMNPTFHNSEKILTNIQSAQLGKLQRGDIITFKAPTDPSKDFLKRIIGVPGDTIQLKDGDVYLNRQRLDESSYLQPSVKTYGGSFLTDNQSITVPANNYFVMGDNRPFSADSREWGFITKNEIIGKYMLCYANCK